jgi:inositol phosphorylceramide mannosyltransferase catalytic subunit
MSNTHVLKKIQIRNYDGRIDRPIPYKIHQTFKTNVIPETMYQAANSYITMNPHYDYYFYTDEDIQDIVDFFDCSGLAFSNADLRKAYARLNTGAGKADLFRYMIVYMDGGCYFDIDTVCLKPLDSFILPEDELVSGIGDRGDLHQWGLVYKKNHPFMKAALNLCVRNILTTSFSQGYYNLEGVGGPPCLDAAIKYVLGFHPRARFNPGIYEIGYYRFHILNSDFFGGAIQFKYANYRKDLEAMNVQYWQGQPLYKS